MSDGENVGDMLSSSRLDSESLPPQASEGNRRSLSDWVRSAQAMLQTPQKPFDRQSKTPEDSAKKKRRFQRFELCLCYNFNISTDPIIFFPFSYIYNLPNPLGTSSAM